MNTPREQAVRAREIAPALGQLTTGSKNALLEEIAMRLRDATPALLDANAVDLDRAAVTPGVPLDRLRLTTERIEAMAVGLEQVSALPDPIGRLLHETVRPDGLRIEKRSVPLGVIAIVYESRPNVTVDAAGLCLKTGNAVILRGSSSALSSNRALVALIQQACSANNIPAHAAQLIDSADRGAVEELLGLRGIIDCVIPRGGAGLIDYVTKTSRVPVIETGAGNCHIYVHADADLKMAETICLNAKVQRPSVCNSAETLLVHEDFAKQLLQPLLESFANAGVECRGCENTRALVPGLKLATEIDYETEFGDLTIAVRIVGSLEEAIAHIERYSTRHSEAIVCKDIAARDEFMARVDSAAVYHNASTRFTDGFEFGFGAEIGISTQKLHARGPMGLPELTTSKYAVFGNGHVRA